MRQIKIIAVLILAGVLVGLETWIEKAARPILERQPGQTAPAGEDHHD